MSHVSEVTVPPFKKARMEQTRKLIGTHNGHFHCDEALAVYLLRQTETYQDADLVRTRDPARLAQCDIVVDVGGVYDEAAQRFDHHQRGFQEVLGLDKYINIKLSSAGLVYKHFGKAIIARRIGLPIDHPNVQILFFKLYGGFIEAIDAIDNGINQYDTDIPPRYRIGTDLSSRVGWLNPGWQDRLDEKGVDERFLKASTLAGEEFLGRLDYLARSWLPARDVVLDALRSRKDVDINGRIILFECFAPWKEHLFNLEEEMSIPTDQKPIYALYEDESKNWRVQAVPLAAEGFENRKSLPEPWRGMRDDVLSELTGIPGCIFVHASGFIAGNKTKDGALQMAKKALEM